MSKATIRLDDGRVLTIEWRTYEHPDPADDKYTIVVAVGEPMYYLDGTRIDQATGGALLAATGVTPP